MKVYLLKIDNGMEYPDNSERIVGVFDTFLAASEYLMDNGFTPVPTPNYQTNEWHVVFEDTSTDVNQFTDYPRQAWITDFTVNAPYIL